MEIAIGNFGEPLVPDSRLERVFYLLQRLVKFPDDCQFVTQLQEPSPNEQRPLAVFMVTSPHPRQKGQKLITAAAVAYSQWKELEREHRHYAGLADPLRPIFAGLLRQHLTARENLEALLDAPVQTFDHATEDIPTIAEAMAEAKKEPSNEDRSV